MAAAVLTIDLNARLAKLEEGLTQANRRLGSFKTQIDGVGNSLKNAFAAVGIGAAVGKFVQLTNAAIDGADHLNDLSKSTGIAVETLGGIGFAAEQAGASLETVVPAIGKLNLEIAKAAEGNPQAAQTFDLLKISVKDASGATKDAGQILVELASKFETFRDGPQKAALANELFKKGYQALVPLLNEGGDSLRQNIEFFQKYSGLTKELADRSDKFNDEVAKLNLLTSAFFRHVAIELLPALQALTKEFTDSATAANGFKSSASDVAEFIKGIAVAAVFTTNAVVSLGRSLGVAAAQATLVAKLDFSGARKLGEDFNRELEESRAKRDRIIEAIRNPKLTAPEKSKGGLPQAPGLPDVDAAKKTFDAQIKALENSIRDEEGLLSDRERFLQTYYQDDELSIREFFDARQTIIDLALNKEREAADVIVAIRQKALAQATGTDREKAEADLAQAIDRRADIEQRAATKSIGLFFEERRALKGFRDDIEQTSIRLLELSGDKVGAALAQFDFGNRQRNVRINLESQSNDPEIRRLAQIARQGVDAEREQIAVQAQLNAVSERFGDILNDIGSAQTRIALARQRGSLTELEALRASGDANQARIAELRQIADAYQEIADKSSDPRAQIAADQLRLRIEELAASTDLVAKKFNDVFVNSFTDAITDFATGAKSLKDIIKDLEKSIVSSISRIAAQNIAETLFKPENLGGIGTFLGGLFGGKPADASGAAGLAGAGASLTGAGATLTTAGTMLVTAATTLTAAAATMSASSFASSFIPGAGGGFGGGFFNPFEGIGFFASGTDSAPGGLAMVGEGGRELVRLPRGSQVIPNDRTERILRGGNSVTVHAPVTVVVQGTPSTKTVDQIGLSVGRGVSRSLRRNG